jgi:hypothetical protein
VADAGPFIFISYSHSDTEFAAKLSDRLKKADIAHFIDQRSITWGEHIPDQVHSALERATHLIVLISPGSEKSSWVAYEMGYARGRRVIVVPYLLHPKMDVPGFIANIRYLCDLKEEAQFIARIKKTGVPTASKPTEGALDLRRGPVSTASPTAQIKSESSNERRAAVIAMGEEGNQKSVPIIEGILKTEDNQNVRESAIKALGNIGGERATTLLEGIWFGSEPARFGKDAAKNALQQLHAWGTDEPLLNPATAEDQLVSLSTRNQEQDHKRNRSEKELLDEILGRKQADLFRAGLTAATTPKGFKVDNFSLSWSVSRLQQQWYYRINYSVEATDLTLADKLIHWAPSSADSIAVIIKYPVEIANIADRARQLGLKVESLLHDRVKVNKLDWPGSPPGKDYGDYFPIEITRSPTGTRVEMAHLPWGLEASWIGCLRLSIRLARFLQA